MTQLPLLNIFPFSFEGDKKHINPFFKDTLGQVSPQPPLITIQNGFDFARYTALKKGTCNHLDFHVEKVLKVEGGPYSVWLKNMPAPECAPQILRYQTHHDNTSVMLEELTLLRTTLTPGQCLFHGGHWSWSLQPGTVVPLNIPLSTSLTAVTATCHSSDSGRKEEGPFYLWVLRVGLAFNSPVYVYNHFVESDHKHEFEVLIAPGGNMRVESCERVDDYFIVGVVLE